jgi:hypothetical protein
MTTDTPIQSRRFTLDGEPLEDVVRFALENDLPGDVQLAIGDLAVGETLLLGGGAAATFTLKRTA